MPDIPNTSGGGHSGSGQTGNTALPSPTFDTGPLEKRITEVRGTLSSDNKRGGTMATADIQIDGVQSQMSAHSRINDPSKVKGAEGLVGEKNIFETSTIPTAAGREVDRIIDAETKILSNIAEQLGNNTAASGTVNLFVELTPCPSCTGVIDQFKAKYPNITVNVMDNNGVRLVPRNEKK